MNIEEYKKERKKIYNKEYHIKNKEKLREYNSNYFQKNKDEIYKKREELKSKKSEEELEEVKKYNSIYQKLRSYCFFYVKNKMPDVFKKIKKLVEDNNE